MGARAWLLPLLLVPAVAGLAVCESVWAAPSAAPPCTANCKTVTVQIPTPPVPSTRKTPSAPKTWAGWTRGEAISEYKLLVAYPKGAPYPIKAGHAICRTFRAWKIKMKAPGHPPGLYIVDERKGTPAGFVGYEFWGSSYPGCKP
jgi:hypothetical protein